MWKDTAIIAALGVCVFMHAFLSGLVCDSAVCVSVIGITLSDLLLYEKKKEKSIHSFTF